MSSIVLSGEPKSTKIVLQTQLGTEITNEQLYGYTPFERVQMEDIKKKYPGVKYKENLIPRSNCHGYTFASSRTCIWETESIKTILKEDGYFEITNHDEVLPGDVILYWTKDGDIEHSGIVLSEFDDQFHVPKIVGRWGRFSEVIHWAHAGPYDFSLAKYYRIKK